MYMMEIVKYFCSSRVRQLVGYGFETAWNVLILQIISKKASAVQQSIQFARIMHV